MKKHIVSLLVAISLIATSIVPAYASEQVVESVDEQIYVDGISGTDTQVIEFDTEYEEVGSDESLDYNSCMSSEKTNNNCRVISVPSAGQLKINCLLLNKGDVRIYLYNEYGTCESVNYFEAGKQHYINVDKGEHYLKLWNAFPRITKSNEIKLSYMIEFSPSEINYNDDESLKFGMENTEYLVGCTMESAESSEFAKNNCRVIKIDKKDTLAIDAYTKGAYGKPDVRVYLYDEQGTALLKNQSVHKEPEQFKVEVKPGKYYLKYWACAGGAGGAIYYKITTSKGSSTTLKEQTISKLLETKIIKSKKLDKKSQAFKLGGKAKTKLAYEMLSSDSESNGMVVDSKGKVIVPKGLAAGTYSLKVKVTAPESKKYSSTSIEHTIKIIVE